MSRKNRRRKEKALDVAEEVVVEEATEEQSERKQKKKKKKEESEISQDFQKDLDDFLMESAGVDVKSLKDHEGVPFWINSGSYALNWVISDDMFKGIPGTKILLVSGEEAKGKSLITDAWLGENIKADGVSYKIDIEDATGEKFTSDIIGDKAVANKIRIISPSTLKAVRKAKGDVSKLNPTDLVITIEKLTSILNKLIDFQLSRGGNKAPSIMVTVDSVSNLSSIKEVEDVTDEKNKRDMTAQQNMRALFRVIGQKLREANITVIGISHLTQNIGVMFGDKKTISAKGSGFKFASSVILNMVSSKEIKDAKTDIAVGVRMKVKVTKNRMAFKGRETFLTMYFKKGIDAYSGLGELLHQFGLVKATTKKGKATSAESDGHFDESTVFHYTTLEGEEISWDSKELGAVLEATGKKKAILKEWNNRLNDAYTNALNAAGVSEEDLLVEDDSTAEDDE